MHLVFVVVSIGQSVQQPRCGIREERSGTNQINLVLIIMVKLFIYFFFQLSFLRFSGRLSDHTVTSPSGRRLRFVFLDDTFHICACEKADKLVACSVCDC